jgi:gamma-glutamyltranspeptidase/glutathione hydrolase
MKKFKTIVFCVLVFTFTGPPHLKTHPYQAQSNAGVFISTGTTESKQVGQDILNRGGSAVDAALASALYRITQDMGYIVSFAGTYGMVYYEAKTGKVYSLDACFKTVLEEDDPLTIQSGVIPNARGVLVPGFMAGVQAAHDRFGKLPFREIFQPAIDLAENGYPLTPGRVNLIHENWGVLGVLPETRRVFLKKPYGLFNTYQPGDIFKQPELAHTLWKVVLHGADYMYTGEWAKRFVRIVRREGGKITLRDMREYEVSWADTAHTTYNGFHIHALGYPSNGAMSVVLGINLMECAGLTNLGHCTSSAAALYRLMYSVRVGEFFYAPYAPGIIKTYIPEGDFSYESRAKKETARLIWEKIESREWPEIEQEIIYEGYSNPGHSEAIIAVDAEGNVAAVCHTINAEHWGNSGIFVDGVSIPAAGYFQQARIDKTGPGNHLPDTTNPCLVLQNGLPVIASSCIGSDLHTSTVQNLYNMLIFGMTASESTDTHKFLSRSGLNQKVQEYTFSQSILNAVEAMGLGINIVDFGPRSYWIGLLITY